MGEGRGRTDDEDPSPAGQPSLTVQPGDSVGEKATESTGNTRRTEKDSETFLGFAALVPPSQKLQAVAPLAREAEDAHGNEVDASREDARLRQTQEETSDEESRVVLHETLGDGDASENEHACGYWGK